MSDADIPKIAIGDEVLVRGIVIADRGEDSLEVQFWPRSGGPFDSLPVPRVKCIFAPPLPIAAGDKVWGTTTKESGEVIHVMDDLVWVKFDDGRHEVLFPSQYERAQ